MNDTYTPEQVWDSAMENERDTAYEEGRKDDAFCSDYYAARNLELYADMFGVDVEACKTYARSEYKGFDWARAHEGW